MSGHFRIGYNIYIAAHARAMLRIVRNYGASPSIVAKTQNFRLIFTANVSQK